MQHTILLHPANANSSMSCNAVTEPAEQAPSAAATQPAHSASHLDSVHGLLLLRRLARAAALLAAHAREQRVAVIVTLLGQQLHAGRWRLHLLLLLSAGSLDRHKLLQVAQHLLAGVDLRDG